ncbi:ATP-dependent Clp protease adapter protein ClpS [Bradyrhizobium sp. LB7.2]
MNEIVPIQLVLHNDGDVPREFFVDLLRRIFGKSEDEAASVMASIEKHATAVCGPYPPSVADALLESARRRIAFAGHPLLITSETAKPCCGLCDQPTAKSEVHLTNRTVWLCARVRARCSSRIPRTTRGRVQLCVRCLELAFLRHLA